MPAGGVFEVEDGFDEFVGAVADDVAGGEAEFGFDAFALLLGGGGADAATVDADADHFAGLVDVRHHFEHAFDVGERWNLHAFDAGDGFAANFVAENEGLGGAAVKEAERDARIRWMDETALAFDDEDFMVLVGENHFLGGTADEIGDDAVDGEAVPFDHDAGLARGDELGVVAAFFQAVGDFDRDNHLADAAIVADGVNAEAIGTEAFAAGDRFFGVLADVCQGDARFFGGFGEFGVVVEEIVKAADDVHLPTADGVENDGSPGSRNLSAGRGDAEEERVGLRSIVELADDGSLADAEEVAAGFADLRGVEQRDDFFALIADDAGGRFAGVGFGVAFGEDDDATRHRECGILNSE